MTWLRWCWSFIKMLYKFLCCSVSLISVLFNIFWFFCNLASASIPWITLTLLAVCIASKFIKLRSPNEKHLVNLLGPANTGAISDIDIANWPIGRRAAGYDAPENSKAAIKKCAQRGYRNILLDAGLTACGEIVLTSRLQLERAGLSGSVAQYTLTELRKINITELHPMGSHFETEHICTIHELAQFLETEQLSLTIFLHINDNSAQMIEKLICFMTSHQNFRQSTIIVSQSPLALYQLRKLQPELICGLWHEKTVSLAILKASTLFTSVYGAILRNIIAPVIGISVVFLSKEEFNLHIAELWRNVGVRPIVYNVNSPNEKRYFQRTMKTQYLTDSFRSEPHLLMKA